MRASSEYASQFPACASLESLPLIFERLDDEFVARRRPDGLVKLGIKHARFTPKFQTV